MVSFEKICLEQLFVDTFYDNMANSSKSLDIPVPVKKHEWGLIEHVSKAHM